MKKITNKASKVSLAQLGNIPRTEWSISSTLASNQPQLFYFEHQGLCYDFLWSPKNTTDTLFVLFSGNAQRQNNTPPVFHRWSWTNFFPGHCLFVSDPLLNLDTELGLGWYIGTADTDATTIIAGLIDDICSRLKIDLRNVYAYGSSGGGFAALRLLNFLPTVAAISINPQTCVLNYYDRFVKKFLEVGFGGMDAQNVALMHSDRINLLASLQNLKNRRILYVQNKLDNHHLTNHMMPFCEALGVSWETNMESDSFKTLIFEHEAGHKQAETSEIFHKIMNDVIDGKI